MSESNKGIGLKGFMGFDPDAERMGGKGDWLPAWKEKGEVVVWLHTLAPIVPCFSHAFMQEDEAEDRDTKKPTRFLRFPKFNSPDAQKVHSNQHFRDKETGVLKIAIDPKGVQSIADPFLLLREWLRHEGAAGRIALDQAVFEWTDFKKKSVIQWQLGELSGLEERGQNWNHTLDTKLEYIMVVVADAKPDRAYLTRESKSLGECIRKTIGEQIEQFGDEEGDPTLAPYAFKWKFDKNARASDMYSAFRFAKAQYTDEIYQAIASETFPDPTDVTKFDRGDMAKIRACFEQAAQIDLPLDLIFSKDPDERRTLLLGNYAVGTPTARTAPATREKPPQTTAKPPATPGGARPSTRPAGAQATQEATAPKTGGRRRLKEPEAAPVAAPEEEKIPCESCGHPMGATETKCPKCGAEYEVDGDAPAEPAPAPKTVAKPAPVAQPEPKKQPTGGPRKPGVANASAEQGGERDAEGEDPKTAAMPSKCWACGSRKIGKNENTGAIICEDCGVEQTDDVPFG